MADITIFDYGWCVAAAIGKEVRRYNILLKKHLNRNDDRSGLLL
jgi:hypothetical protein